MKKNFYHILFFTGLITCALTSLNAQPWISDTWAYRRLVTIANPGSTVLTNYQVKITLDNTFNFAYANGDGSDIRITSDDGTTYLPFWIETWNPAGQQATIWVKVPNITTPAGTTIYMYYGNLVATSVSSAANTFILGADFEDGTVGALTVNTAGSGIVVVPTPLSQYMYGLKVDGWVKQPNPVLPKRPGYWDDIGSREISPVISESDGTVVEENGVITAYYMGIGLGSMSGPFGIGIAKSSDGGYTWGDRLSAPVIAPSGIPGSWYQGSVQQPSVLKRSSDGLLMMMAAGWTGPTAYTSGSLGVFTSTDGVNWTDQGQKLTLSQFHYDASNGIDQIGVSSIIKRSVNGDYFLLFEGIKAGASGQWRIFAATSSDFTGTWTPFNGGYPIFQETGTGWESWGVANPHVVEMAPNQFVMMYNGMAGATWRVGFASTTDFITWTRYWNNPVLQPSLSWDGTHNETSFLVKTGIGSTGMLYFQGFDASGVQVGLATNSPGEEAGRFLHGNSSTVTSGWVVGNMLDATSPFIWEFLTYTPTDPLSLSSGLDIGLCNWPSVPAPTTNTIWHTRDGIMLQRLASNGQFQINYTNTSGSARFWNGSSWTTSATWFGGLGVYKVKIWDDGTNYKVDIISTATGLSILAHVASIAKTSVRPLSLGRVIEVSEPFTNYYAIDANIDNWIVHKYATIEPLTTVGTEETNPLPVELSSFSANIIGSKVNLSWTTEIEVNNYGFEIERASSSTSPVQGWTKIGFVGGNGNSNSPKNYIFEEDGLLPGKYSYRLKQIDNDGQFEYSKTVEIDFDIPKKFELSQNYPNPFNPVTTIRFSLPEGGNVKLTLYNPLGQEIKTMVNEYKASGTHIINFDASDLNSGMYIYKLESGSLVQTRKMILLK